MQAPPPTRTTGKAPSVGPPGAGGGAGVTLDERPVAIADGASVLLDDIPPPPTPPTTKASTAAPPHGAIANLGSQISRSRGTSSGVRGST
jgi:hypothetical protein